MKKFGIISCIFAMCFFCYAFEFSSDDKLEETADIALTVKAEKMIYRLEGELVEFTVYIANNSEEAIEIIEPAIDRRSLFIEIELPDATTDNMVAIYGLNLKTIRLQPGKRVKYSTTFKPEVQGEHIIKVSYYGVGENPVKANPVVVFIVSPK